MNDLRLNCNVTRGEIDNTHRGAVVLRLWVYGEIKPYEFTLAGDCLRDLAGCHFYFANTPLEPFKALDTALPKKVTTGVVGEITASARLCMHKPNELGQYEKPVYVNVLRLEFFCELGRVLLESFDCQVKLISQHWSMSEDEEFAQKASNFAAWQSHVKAVPISELNSNAQQLSLLYDEIHQRFADSMDFDQYEASLMGWDGILSALADERDANTNLFELEDLVARDAEDLFSAPDMIIDPTGNITEEEWDEAIGPHPILESVQDLIEDFEVQAAKLTFPRGRYYQRLINTLDEVEEGLTGLLNPVIVDDIPADIGMIGCREYLGKMMVAFEQLSKLMEVTETDTGRRELLYLRDGMLDLREGISALRFELHNL